MSESSQAEQHGATIDEAALGEAALDETTCGDVARDDAARGAQATGGADGDVAACGEAAFGEPLSVHSLTRREGDELSGSGGRDDEIDMSLEAEEWTVNCDTSL